MGENRGADGAGHVSTGAGLSALFAPRSIAVVGATAAPEKAGFAMMESLSGFGGDLLPVNPRAAAAGQQILGRPAHESVAAIGAGIDLAVIVVPPAAVPAALTDCGAAGVRAAVICAGGFAESGPEGARLQEQIQQIAEQAGIRLLGPNTSGFMNPAAGVFANFMPAVRELAPGPVSVVAQSGGVNLVLSFLLAQAGLGLRLGVGLGNAVDVSFPDVLDHLARDEGTTAVGLHVEGIADGPGVMAAVRRLAARKPVVALKVGRNDVGDFAQSHTGALTGSYELTCAALAQAGAVLVTDPTEMVDALTALAHLRLAPAANPGVGVITGQAGPGLIIADHLTGAGIAVPELQPATTARLAELLAPLTYQRNPVDTGRPSPAFPEVVGAVAADPGIDVLGVYALDEPGALDPAAALAAAEGRVVFASGGPAEVLRARATGLAGRGIPMVDAPDRLARALTAVVADARAQHQRTLDEPVTGLEQRMLGATPDEDAAKSLIAAAGLPLGARRVATTHAEARAALAELGGPLVVKVLHPRVLHKSDVGGVHVGVRDEQQLAAALAAIDAIEPPPEPGTGVAAPVRYLLERQAGPGTELIVGAVRDATFGPVVALARGGVEVELGSAAALRVAPVGHHGALAMVDALPAALLAGHRGAPPVDRGALARVITAVSELICTYPDVTEIDLNPVRATADGLVVLDALIITDPKVAPHAPVP